MGKVVAAKSYLRAWGSNNYLDTKGMFKTNLTTASGATKRTWVYVVAGARPEPLLGDHDAKDLGIISFNPEGRPQQGDESHEDVRNVSIPAMLRKAGKEVVTERPPLHKVSKKLLAALRFQVQRNGALVIIENREVNAVHALDVSHVRAGSVAAEGILDLYHVCPKKPQKLGARWPCLHSTEVENLDSFQCLIHTCSLS